MNDSLTSALSEQCNGGSCPVEGKIIPWSWHHYVSLCHSHCHCDTIPGLILVVLRVTVFRIMVDSCSYPRWLSCLSHTCVRSPKFGLIAVSILAEGCPFYLMAVPPIWWLYHLYDGCLAYLMAVPSIWWPSNLSGGCPIYLMAVLPIWWLPNPMMAVSPTWWLSCISYGCSAFQMAILPIWWISHLSGGCPIYLVAVPSIW